MSANISPARRSALYLLGKVLGEGRLLSELLSAGALERLAPEDRARAQRLANDTLRGLERADRLIGNHVRRMPPLQVLNVMRLATVELVDGAAAHGVVNEAVAYVGASRDHKTMRGMVNAVLRKVAGEAPEAWPKMRVPRLPEWLRDPLVEAWGEPRMAAMEAVQFEGAPLDLTAKGDARALADLLGGTLLPTGSVRVHGAGQVSALPGYDTGAWWVQDAAAALPVRMLAPKPDESVLDLCAAPGGKTMQIAATGAKVRAVDDSSGRMARVEENLARTGLKAELVVGDVMEQSGQWDAILLDAPCSATGTIRRHPDLPHAKDGSEIGELIELQSVMLDHAVSLLAPGGRLVFCTCSLLPDEGEVQIEEALARHADLRVDRTASASTGLPKGAVSQEGGLRITPDMWADMGGMDGFYMACLRKAG